MWRRLLDVQVNAPTAGFVVVGRFTLPPGNWTTFRAVVTNAITTPGATFEGRLGFGFESADADAATPSIVFGAFTGANQSEIASVPPMTAYSLPPRVTMDARAANGLGFDVWFVSLFAAVVAPVARHGAGAPGKPRKFDGRLAKTGRLKTFTALDRARRKRKTIK